MKRGLAQLVTGLLMLTGLAAARVTMRADTKDVWLLGHRTAAACTFRQHFGVPCPNCGMSRSLILSMHGNLHEAMLLNPAGPLLIAGIIGAALLLLGGAASRNQTRVARWMLPSVLIYAVIYVAVLIGHWLFEIL